MSEQYAGHSRRPGAAQISKFETAGIAGEIKYREQEALSRKSESDHTESEISCTKQTIAGIMQRLKEKARERNERIRKLMERRQSFETVGKLTGGERAVPDAPETKGDSEAERSYRQISRERLSVMANKKLIEANRKLQTENEKVSRVSCLMYCQHNFGIDCRKVYFGGC
mgnify:FL=1